MLPQKTNPDYQPFEIRFEGGTSARAVHCPRHGDPETILSALGLKNGPTLFIIGGASLMEEESEKALQTIIREGLAQFVQENQLTIIDGGTASGVMALMGAARKEGGFSFPLVGVAPRAQVSYPGHVPPNSKTQLDPFHSHFVLTDGDDFGAESDMIAMLTTAISRDRRFPAIGLVINGGKISQREVFQRSASGQMIFPLLVFAGSGRLADELAQTAQGQPVEADADELAEYRQILAKDVQFIHVREGADALKSRLKTYFAP